MAPKAKILLIEDNPIQAKQVKRMLEESGYDILHAKDGITGLKMVTSINPDVVILDVVLPDISGHEVCRWIKLREETRGIPVVMLTVKGTLEEKVAGLQLGADDYLPKPFNESELNARIYASLRTKEFQEELKKKNLQLEELLKKVEVMAITDPGTGLYNRRRFQDALQHEFSRAKRYNERLSLMIIDIDHFKIVNDTFGHQVGDGVLAEIAEVITKQFREVDLVARYGGEEFAVLLPQSSVTDATIPANRLLTEVENYSFKCLEGNKRKITVSIGLTGLPDPELNTEDQLVHCADVALYKAKRNGRNRLEFCEGKDLPKHLS
jgi:two-component system, cell cycle response regulator